MGQVTYKFFLDGNEVNAPKNWSGLQVLATFDQDSVQANISSEEFIFVNSTAQLIKTYLLGGLTLATNGIFEGLSFSILVDDGVTNLTVFDGYLDFETYEVISPVEIKCSVKKTNGLNSLSDRADANSFGYLEDEGFITNADYIGVPYLVEKLDNEGDIAILTVTIFLLAYNIQQQIQKLKEQLAIVAGMVLTGLTGSLASLIYLGLSVIANLIFLGVMVTELAKLVKQLVEIYFPPYRYHQGMTLRKMMEKSCEYLGYDFVSPITDLDSFVYLPSSPKEDVPILKGIPKARDYGYSLGEAFELCLKLFNGKIAIIGNELHLRNLDDVFWNQNSNYYMPSILDEKIKYNNADFKARTFIEFQTDVTDDWTVDNYTGTSYEIITTPINGNAGADRNLMKGLKDISIPCALGTRKASLNEVELKLLEITQLADKFVNFFGGGSNYSNIVSQRFGALLVSQKIHSVPKLLVMEGGKIPENYRTVLKAKSIYENYYEEGSFVANDFNGQRRLYEGRKIPFGFSDFIKTIDNSYFTSSDGRKGKIQSLKWELNSDFAIVDFWVQETYTKNLKEKFIE